MARTAVKGTALTPRELMVIDLVAQGLTNAEIAARLFVGTDTVKSQLLSLMCRLGARNRAHAVTLAFCKGYLRIPGARQVKP